MIGRAIIFKRKKQLLLRVPTFKVEYRFRLVSPNGEPIAQSEGYTQKHNVKSVLATYFPNFEVDDQTGEA